VFAGRLAGERSDRRAERRPELSAGPPEAGDVRCDAGGPVDVAGQVSVFGVEPASVQLELRTGARVLQQTLEGLKVSRRSLGRAAPQSCLGTDDVQVSEVVGSPLGGRNVLDEVHGVAPSPGREER
jgi:hypothetical protein